MIPSTNKQSERQSRTSLPQAAHDTPYPGIFVSTTTSLTSQGYAQAVQSFANLETRTGENHSRLAHILRPLARAGSYQATDRPERLVTLYRFTNQAQQDTISQQQSSSQLRWHLERPFAFSSCRSFYEYQVPTRDESTGQIIFLNGHASAEWIALLGSKYRIDPEFFARVLDFRSPWDRTNNFSNPSLPGMSWNIVRLPLMTLGSRDVLKQDIEKREINEIRMDCARMMRTFLENLCRNQTFAEDPIPVGNSYVRDYYLLDSTHFAIEQSISICLQPAEGLLGWTAMVWNDAGSTDLKEGYLDGPWSEAKRRLLSQRTSLFPIISYKPNMGLLAHKISREKTSTHDFHIDYGRSLRQELMVHDAFYALHETFMHSACSENQFLNLMDIKLTQCINEAIDAASSESLTGLNYFKEILYHHGNFNGHVSSFIKRLDNSKWPKTSGDKEIRQQVVVLECFQALAEKSRTLYARCEGAITVLMNTMSIKEAQRSLSQAERLAKLTFLAFVFVPLSFTTSFFGMNLKELGNPDSPRIFAWIGLLVPTTLLALMFLYVDFSPLARKVALLGRKVREAILGSV